MKKAKQKEINMDLQQVKTQLDDRVAREEKMKLLFNSIMDELFSSLKDIVDEAIKLRIPGSQSGEEKEINGYKSLSFRLNDLNPNIIVLPDVLYESDRSTLSCKAIVFLNLKPDEEPLHSFSLAESKDGYLLQLHLRRKVDKDRLLWQIGISDSTVPSGATRKLAEAFVDHIFTFQDVWPRLANITYEQLDNTSKKFLGFNISTSD